MLVCWLCKLTINTTIGHALNVCYFVLSYFIILRPTNMQYGLHCLYLELMIEISSTKTPQKWSILYLQLIKNRAQQ